VLRVEAAAFWIGNVIRMHKQLCQSVRVKQPQDCSSHLALFEADKFRPFTAETKSDFLQFALCRCG